MTLFANVTADILFGSGDAGYGIIKLLLAIAIFSAFTLGAIKVDQILTRSGFKILSPIELGNKKRALANIALISCGYFFLTCYAFLVMLLVMKPIMDSFIVTSIGLNIDYVLLIFLLSSGIIVRVTYILISPSYGNVMWDFYAIPGIFTFFGMFTVNAIYGNKPLFSFPYIEMLQFAFVTVALGLIVEIILVLYRRKNPTIEHHLLHEALDFVPLSSKLIFGRDALYQNVVERIKIGAGETEIKSIVGTSIYFDTGPRKQYLEALEAFNRNSASGSIRYMGPLKKIEDFETNEEFDKRIENAILRRDHGARILHYPLNMESFRFIVINQKYVSIEFPTNNPQKPGKDSRSTVAITFENGFIASMIQTIFENMWTNGEDILSK